MQRPLLGITLKLLSVLVFVVMNAMVKSVAAGIPAGEIVFFRSAFAVPVILIWLASSGGLRTGLRPHNVLSHFWRGLIGTLGMGLNFAALAYLTLPDSTAIGYTAPLLVVILSAMFLGEEVRLFRFACVMLGLCGVIVVLLPRLSIGPQMQPAQVTGIVMALFGATCVALSQVFVRKLVHSESTSAIVFYFSVFSALISLVSLPFGWVWPTPFQAAILVGCGLIGGLGQILMTKSYREADVSLVAPFDYASMLFSLAIGYFAFGEVASTATLIGAGIIVSAGLLIIWRERKLGLERARGRGATTP